MLVYFSLPDSHVRVTARGEVKNHYFLNFADGKGECGRCRNGSALFFV